MQYQDGKISGNIWISKKDNDGKHLEVVFSGQGEQYKVFSIRLDNDGFYYLHNKNFDIGFLNNEIKNFSFSFIIGLNLYNLNRYSLNYYPNRGFSIYNYRRMNIDLGNIELFIKHSKQNYDTISLYFFDYYKCLMEKMNELGSWSNEYKAIKRIIS